MSPRNSNVSRTPTRGLTPKERVLKKVPTAYAAKGHGFYAGMWCIRDLVHPENIWSNHCHTAAGAWSAAAKELPNGK